MTATTTRSKSLPTQADTFNFVQVRWAHLADPQSRLNWTNCKPSRRRPMKLVEDWPGGR